MNRERCNGSYENVNGEFGKVIRRECIGCQRRIAQGEPIKVLDLLAKAVKIAREVKV